MRSTARRGSSSTKASSRSSSTSPRGAWRSCRPRTPGLPEYDLFLNADGTACFVHEHHRDSAAGLEQMTNIGTMMEPLSQVCTMIGEVCGMPSPELRKKLEAAGVTIYEPLQSLWP